MAKDNKISMPSSGGGLVRYFDESVSKIRLKPGYVIIMVAILVVIELLLHWQGNSILGI
ncbi:preprotein translocase subunit Sec61beta [Candidatus Woesearchaeota archaeon]|jgi:preprotein translocase subunit Sec61beta|nr:preprotein translocase subunit Sec61beta [Candidatus Woesearchaeota archaeon]MBT3537532.1 preprotein translocase subunit Sec61beta [Candidatus Woesearchaeota archaeon]MBT4696836.1 preprotein translocase subunit Sec61beta [Candidatus Woesearchaeota archaeon]MBT4717283.1 preprotein translocase subunit Sec61beta [Candidatus Woesearchaeota archaeon]MBT7106158.1 preprotein translocase subunit Sec61beta [Candidatus Woesearchaeota archaeon]